MNRLFFFVGTEAELIKIFPVMIELDRAGKQYSIIGSGQNNIRKSRILDFLSNGNVDIILSEEKNIKKSFIGLFEWYIKTRRYAKQKIIEHYGYPDKNDVMIVHGDTISTVMGAYLGKRLGMKVAHVEAGLRSFNWLNPFPEEIDRSLVSRVADIHFAPNELGVNNLKGKENVINTGQNTLLDSLRYAMSVPCKDEKINKLENEDFFVFVIHRQENISNNKLIFNILRAVENALNNKKCVCILHKITEIKFRELGILEEICNDPRIITFSRVDYFDFMKLLSYAAFVITDGGSNQQELSYMGVPTFIVRKTTETYEGIGRNAVLMKNDPKSIEGFISEYERYRMDSAIINDPVKPSEIIVKELMADMNLSRI